MVHPNKIFLLTAMVHVKVVDAASFGFVGSADKGRATPIANSSSVDALFVFPDDNNTDSLLRNVAAAFSVDLDRDALASLQMIDVFYAVSDIQTEENMSNPLVATKSLLLKSGKASQQEHERDADKDDDDDDDEDAHFKVHRVAHGPTVFVHLTPYAYLVELTFTFLFPNDVDTDVDVPDNVQILSLDFPYSLEEDLASLIKPADKAYHFVSTEGDDISVVFFLDGLNRDKLTKTTIDYDLVGIDLAFAHAEESEEAEESAESVASLLAAETNDLNELKKRNSQKLLKKRQF
ncbi:hypothetical protein SBRCBS47491_006971 [Sporothrix bragantina]|uniref:Uncharacterized protein n=1 Tax=Sporothrix bragantina TaxID=671064 RepID=A0ABP0CBL1_9PEZI